MNVRDPGVAVSDDSLVGIGVELADNGGGSKVGNCLGTDVTEKNGRCVGLIEGCKEGARVGWRLGMMLG